MTKISKPKISEEAKRDNNLLFFAVQVYITETKQNIREMFYSRNPQDFKDEMTAKFEVTLEGLERLAKDMKYIR